MVWLFVIGYVFIALEHVIKIDKSASAVLTAVVLWTWLILFGSPLVPDMDQLGIEHALLEHLGDIGSILFFLLAAMTIVELVDVHDGFRIITKQINTLNKVKLLWIISLVTFFLSALLDNLTTTIVMATLIRKLIHDHGRFCHHRCECRGRLVPHRGRHDHYVMDRRTNQRLACNTSVNYS